VILLKSWKPVLGIAGLPSLAAALLALTLPGTAMAGVLAGAALTLPFNFAAVGATSAVIGGDAAVLLVAIIGALAIRVVGIACVGVLLHLLAPHLLAPALITFCVLLVTALVAESVWHARRFLAPSTTESARA
jgi:hypothetical protein